MGLNRYSCSKCDHIDVYWDSELPKCPKCVVSLKRIFKAPLKNKITDKVDKYHNIDAQQGIQEDAKTRSVQHVQDTLDEMICEFGEEVAKEQGWILWDETKKKWRRRDNWDINLLNKENKGSAKILNKVAK